MAARKQFLGVKETDPKLKKLLEDARKKPATEEELHEQRVSFAFGNAPESAFITKDTVRAASRSIRLHDA
ncbi:MAG TPA: hypothetical protein VFW35_04930 [Sphingomicrobium sp.]|nr:hypothetical protein [Sphingomicrobium sp.]